MRALRQWRMPWWLRATEQLHLARLVRGLRYDTRYLPAAERASDDDGLRMLALAVHARRYDFELRRLPHDASVLIEDVGFNAIFAAANRALVALAGPLDPELAGAFDRHRESFDQLWHEPTQQYCSRDAVTHGSLTEPTVAGFLPLWGGVVTEARAEQLVHWLQAPATWPAYPVPSVPLDAPDFHESRYWKGPTWVNTNWAVIQGLERYGYDDLADDLRRRTLDLVDRAGFSEYFSPTTGEGYGAAQFSWTAALAIDLTAARAPIRA
jgi:glycogen debranching enzyme